MEDIHKRLNISKPYICGGAPRDKVLNKLTEISDLDITTGDKTVDYIAKELSVLMGKKFAFKFSKAPDGHSTIQLGNLKIDFSSNFNTPNIDEHLKKIGITNPTEMQRELFSRDFTCNTLLMSLDLKNISDPTGLGFKDIDAKIIKTCLAPDITLREQNRIIRVIYLAAKLDFNVDPDIITWVKNNPGYVKLTSVKTLEEKLTKAMSYNPDKTVHLLEQMALWNYVPIAEKLYPYYKGLKNDKKGS